MKDGDRVPCLCGALLLVTQPLVDCLLCASVDRIECPECGREIRSEEEGGQA